MLPVRTEAALTLLDEADATAPSRAAEIRADLAPRMAALVDRLQLQTANVARCVAAGIPEDALLHAATLCERLNTEIALALLGITRAQGPASLAG